MENQIPSGSSLEAPRSMQARDSVRTDHVSERGSQTPASAVRSRSTATPGQSFLQRHRLRRSRDDADQLSESLSTVQQAVDRLSEATNPPTSHLDEPVSRIETPDILASEYHGEAEVNRRRSKRRKMDSDPVDEQHRYGYHGRVVSGALKMGILLCDGGYITESGRSKTLYYTPQNILRNDKSVYCTQAGECNIIFCHMGNQPFSLKKVVLKAPKSGFDAPIQEGMIFVSMTSETLLARTSQYRLREKSPSTLPTARTPPRDLDSRDLGLAWYTDTQYPQLTFGQFPRDSADDRPPSRRTGYPAANLINPSASYPRRTMQGLPPHDTMYPLVDLNSSPHHQTTAPAVPVTPIYNSTTSYEDPSGDEEEESSPTVLADLADRCRRDYPFTSSSEDEDDEGPTQAQRRRIRRLRAAPRKMVWEEIGGPGGVVPLDPMPKVEMLAPHAKFFIESKQSVVSVKFDPPVCGKFILFKLWSPAEGQNIDIQSIMCYGFAGPRYFPDIKLM